MNQQVFAATDNYISTLFAEEDEALKEALENNEAAGMPAIDISPVQGRLLQVLAHMCGARHVLELGTLGGYSTIWLARALPADGRLITVELMPEYASVARTNIDRAGIGEKVAIRVGRALDVLAMLEKEGVPPFDMIFMDADKPPYTEYLEWALRHSRPGTVIVADNVIRGGRVLDANSSDPAVKGVQRFNEALAAAKGVTQVVIQTIGAKEHDGVAIAVVS